MTPRTKAIVVAILHVVIVSTLGAKLLVDRSIRPRVWVEIEPYDPDLPIRGRYVSLRVKAIPHGFPETDSENTWGQARLSVENGKLIATSDPLSGESVRISRESGDPVVVLSTPVAYFIPEHVPDPSRTPGLVLEVTVPRKGPPRPIRLGVKEGDLITPLDL